MAPKRFLLLRSNSGMNAICESQIFGYLRFVHIYHSIFLRSNVVLMYECMYVRMFIVHVYYLNVAPRAAGARVHTGGSGGRLADFQTGSQPVPKRLLGLPGAGN